MQLSPSSAAVHSPRSQAYQRKPLSVAGRVVKTSQKTSAGTPLYLCKDHKEADCTNCFDWPKLIRAQNKNSKKEKEKGKVNDRERVLGLLQSMGVEFPPESKLSDEVLERRLTAALNYAQDMNEFVKVMPLKPGELPLWKVSAYGL